MRVKQEMLKHYSLYLSSIKISIISIYSTYSKAVSVKISDIYIVFETFYTIVQNILKYQIHSSNCWAMFFRTFLITTAINPLNHLLYMPPKSMLILRLIRSNSLPPCQPRGLSLQMPNQFVTARYTHARESSWSRRRRTLWRLSGSGAHSS